MNRPSLSFIVCAILLAAPAPFQALANPSVSPPSVTSTTPITNAQVDALLAGDTSADAGMVDTALQADAVHVFTLKNATTAPVNISGVRGTCGCEHIALMSGGREQNSLLLSPGQEFQVRLGVRLDGQPAGEISKIARVLGGPSGIQTLATLSLTFKVRLPLVFEPSRLDIGSIPAGGGASATVALHMDKMAGANDTPMPDLKCDDPAISAVRIGDPVTEIRDGKSGITVQYQISLKNLTVLGSFNAALHTVWPANATGTPSAMALPISYRVVGDLAVAPQAVNFGFVFKGVSTTRSLIVFGKSVDDLNTAAASSVNSWLQVQAVTGAHVTGSGASGVLNVVLTDSAPSGAIQSNISIKTANGERLQVPVSAFVGN